MEVIIEMTINKCSKCPYYTYGGTSWSEDIYLCDKSGDEIINPDIVPNTCPFVESTMEKLKNLAYKKII